MPKVAYSTEEREKIINRAKDYMQRKPDAPRTKVATYAGVGLSVLIRWAKEDDFVIPEPITSKQRMEKTPWKGTII
jgi:hypothetical protein|tara:strand:- start:1793 stop:2020 length:228 start_codon:yes stop_codon:yes gene_type:complete